MADAEDMVKAEEEARAIEMWKIKKLIKSLEAARLPPPSPRVPLGPRTYLSSLVPGSAIALAAPHWAPGHPAHMPSGEHIFECGCAPQARGNGTSMISLIIPPKDQVSRVMKMLNEEQGTATNIKSRVNRLSVLSAITSTMERLKQCVLCPPRRRRCRRRQTSDCGARGEKRRR